jgi:hypothetical protein
MLICFETIIETFHRELEMISLIKTAYQKLLDIFSPEIIPHPKNMNQHSEEQIKRLAELILYQGQRLPIIISKRSGFIVAGHGRWEAIKILAKDHGWDKIAVDFQDFENEAQEYAFMTSDNAIAEWSTLDLSMVNTEMLEFGPDFNIDLLGIKDFTIEPIEKFEMEDELRDDLNKKFILEITFPNDMEMHDIKDDLISRGYIVKVKDK